MLPIAQAISLAHEKGLDLVEIAPNAKPPVCKIVDWKKFLYQEKKKEKGKKKGQKGGQVKRVRITLKISPHDIETRVNQVEKFLKKGYKTKLEIFLRGREKAMPILAQTKLTDFYNKINSIVPIVEDGQMKRTMNGFEIIIGRK